MMFNVAVNRSLKRSGHWQIILFIINRIENCSELYEKFNRSETANKRPDSDLLQVICKSAVNGWLLEWRPQKIYWQASRRRMWVFDRLHSLSYWISAAIESQQPFSDPSPLTDWPPNKQQQEEGKMKFIEWMTFQFSSPAAHTCFIIHDTFVMMEILLVTALVFNEKSFSIVVTPVSVRETKVAF